MDMQISNDFIGRENEIAIFEEWLRQSSTQWILYFYDKLKEKDKKGGIGKTFLLRKCATLAQEQGSTTVAMVDFFNIGDRDGLFIAERVAEKLESVYLNWKANTFHSWLSEYHGTEKNDHADAWGDRGRLFDALATDLQYLRQQLLDYNTYLILFFDTYELIEQNPVVAVLSSSHLFPDNYLLDRIRVVMAGRNELDWEHPNWAGREAEVKAVPLATFKQEEMVQYLQDQSISLSQDKEIVQALHERTEGRPILIGLVADVLHLEIISLTTLVMIPIDEFEDKITNQINQFQDSVGLIIPLMAHVYHRFNLDLLTWLLETKPLEQLAADIKHDIESNNLLENLLRLSFVRQSGVGQDFVLHDEMRRLVNIYWWERQDPDKNIRRELSQVMIQHYVEQEQQRHDEQIRQMYIVERLYHQLFLDNEEGFEYFRKTFSQALDLWQKTFARSLFQETQLFAQDFSPEQHDNFMLAEADLLRSEEDSEAALTVYQKLEKEASTTWLEKHSSEILYGKGSIFLRLSRFAESINCFEQCLLISELKKDLSRYAEILGILGYIHRRQGELGKAVGYYERSIVINKKIGDVREYANMLNNTAYLYRLQGNIEEALRMCKIALSIRRSLEQKHQGSKIAIGMSWGTMGTVYLDIGDLVAAQECFDKAFEIYNDNTFKRGIAATYNRFGQVQLARGQLNEAKQFFEKGFEASYKIDQEVRINSLNKQGRVLALQKRWDEAILFFEDAIALAIREHDYYQQAESSIDLAEALEHKGKLEQVDQALKIAENITTNYNYNDLSGRIEEVQGDSKYDNGDYNGAFEHYKVFCHFMALYNRLRYDRALRKIVDRLLEVSIAQPINGIVGKLIEYWINNNLYKDYPEFIKVCKEVTDLPNF